MKQKLGEGRVVHHKLRWRRNSASKDILQELCKVEVHRKDEVFYIYEWYDVPYGRD